VPKGEVKSGFNRFALDVSHFNYPAPAEELWVKHLRTDTLEIIGLGKNTTDETRLEDYLVAGLVDFDDIAYDQHADLLYDLSSQAIAHFRSYLGEDTEVRKVLRIHQREIARNIHAQMQEHFWEGDVEFDTVISRGFTDLKDSAFTASKDDVSLDFRISPADKSNMQKYLFTSFQRCLYKNQKFHSDSERRLAVILDRDSQKWFRPAKGQFQIFYKFGHEHPEYQPDFVAETREAILMLEPKAKNEMDDPVVSAKKDAAVTWCRLASEYAASHNGKPWVYTLIPHDAILENMSIEMLVGRFRC
jgi:type III restriction enzyme